MAAVFVVSRHCSKEFCRKISFSKANLPRSRRAYFPRSGHTRRQYGQGFGKNEIQPEIPQDVSKLRMIMRPLAFTIMTGAVSFGTCSILNYERVRNSYIHASKSYSPTTSRLPKLFGLRDELNKWWNSLPGGSKTAAGIIFLNTAVFLLWRIPRMQPFMYKWFTASPGAVSSITLLSSTFSHMDLWHLGINMFVLWSFAPHIEVLLGKEQFIAFYLTGGVVASFASTAYRIAISSYLGASLGASGALLAVLSFVCIKQPDTRLAIVFLPFFTFSAGKGLLAIVGLDVAGLLFRWQLFDHAAHLGGVLFGAWYLKFGNHYLWEKRGWLVSQWHKIRGGHKRT
ncbi:hypothetical protein OS493_022293 [Desmophyllum pertusum]|uniref:rhomboid protease n=1 Tax=Desmophyllum pertusum TaxID=174260 RepID=A0A9W9YEC8_9CNID|nr:hypothetical protein OS493_022293 [Desmophyllum pertusum]